MTHRIAAFVTLLLLLALTACTAGTSGGNLLPPLETVPATAVPPAATPGPLDSGGHSEPSTPIMVHMTLSHAPLLNETAVLSMTISSIADAPGTTAQFVLPDGVGVQEGSLTWEGDLAAKEMRTLVATITFTKAGNYDLEGKALRPAGNGDVWGDAAHIYLYVSATNSHAGYETAPPPATGGQDVPTPPAITPAP